MRLLSIGIGLLLIVSACSKDCVNTDERCSQSIPTGTTCMAHFQSWIYSKSTKKCTLESYSGCSPIGFETKEACEKCDCN